MGSGGHQSICARPEQTQRNDIKIVYLSRFRLRLRRRYTPGGKAGISLNDGIIYINDHDKEKAMARKSLGYVNLEWICPRCGSKNPGVNQTCVSCGGPQPEDTAFQQSDGQPLITGEEAEKIAQKGADIICAYCSTRNPGDATVCSNCGADLKEGKQREAGAVVGAFQQSNGSETIPCPHCGQPNPKTALKCASCGASLAVKASPTPAAPPAQKGKLNPLWIIIGVVGLLALIILCVVLLVNGAKTEAITGTVSAASWETSAVIEQYSEVQNQTWKEDVPADATLGTCDYRYLTTSDQPAAVSTEVCGTPYTVDQGNGVGEVVQDCSYEVYAEYCSYTTMDWVTLDTVTRQGNDYAPQYPDVQLGINERTGGQDETFSITFNADGNSYTYTTSDFDLYQQAQIGSRWTLNVTSSGAVRSIEPAK
jgi:ribosomal protein L40E